MAYLRLYLGDVLQRQWKLETDLVSIGRSTDNEIVLPSPGVSKHHAVIAYDGYTTMVIDQNSANGTFVNGAKIQRRTLNYWDEIQIFNYVVKFMAVARLPGEQAAPSIDTVTLLKDESTREIDISDLSDLKFLRTDRSVPHLIANNNGDGNQTYLLEKVNFNIGRSKNCEHRIRGWFIPRISAQIQRRTNEIFLLRQGRGKLLVNGKKCKKEYALKDGDEIMVRGNQFQFYNRPLERNR